MQTAIAVEFAEKVKMTSLKAIDSRVISGRPSVCDACSKVLTFYLSSEIKNGEKQAQPFVTIIELRNQDGITQFLQFQSGRLDVNATSNIGIMWDPGRAGAYELRSFVLSNFTQPEVLSSVHTANLTVS